MAMHNANNERTKRRYFGYLKEAKRQSEATVDAVASALDRFEAFTKRRDFKAFHFEQAVSFKKHLMEQTSQRTGERLSKATMHAAVAHLKRFFQWLAWEPGYRSRLQYSDADYFNLSAKDTRIATAKRDQTGPTLEQVRHVIASMPIDGEIQRRNRALIAFTILTGARDGAIASMKLKHVDLVANSVFQDARDVRTKYSKTFTTYFFPVSDEIRQVVAEWVAYLQEQKLWGSDAPLFPMSLVEVGASRQFEVVGLQPAHWSSATPIRKIFQDAFLGAGLPYCNPHSFRNTLVRYGQSVCKNPEEFKAWSQNLGHEGVLTTFLSYGDVARTRQGEIMRELGTPRSVTQPNVADIVRATVREILSDAECRAPRI
jgi:integrase